MGKRASQIYETYSIYIFHQRSNYEHDDNQISFASLRTVQVLSEDLGEKLPLSCVSFNLVPEGISQDSLLPNHLS